MRKQDKKRQYYTEVEIYWLCELIIDFGGQKRNQIQQYFILVQ